MAKSNANKHRSAELAKIHIAKADLGISDDIYRDMIRAASDGKTETSAKLNWQGRRNMLDRFRELGWQPRHTGKQGSTTPSRPLASFPEAKMARGLWIELHQMHQVGAPVAVKNPSEKALNSFVKRMTGVEDFRWIRTQDKLSTVIEALKAWLDRARTELFAAWWQQAHPGRPLDPILAAGVHGAVRAREPWILLNDIDRNQMHPALYAVMLEYTTCIRERKTW
jgi:phage gp16-like protein